MRNLVRSTAMLAAASSAAATVAFAGPANATSLGQEAVSVAAAQAGKPYVYGAAGPNAFDCSGLVQYVYGRLGHHLPRTALEQYRSTVHVARAAEQPGDLVFMANAGASTNPAAIDHVGIYAGNGSWWVARHSGTTITLQHIYSANVWVGRVS